jgi:GAF domain-containing protein
MEDGIPSGKGLIGICAQTGKEIVSQDVHQDERYRHVEGLDDAQSEICMPLISNEKTLGVLQIISENLNAFHDNDIMVLQILADAIAVAIENANLFDDLFEKTWASTVMLQVAEAAQSFDDMDDLLGAIVRIMPLMVGVEKCAIFIRKKYTGEFILNAYHGFEKNLEPKLAMLPYDMSASECFHQVSVLRIPLNLDESLLTEGQPGCPQTSVSYNLIPMVAHEKFYGILMIDQSCSSGNVSGRTVSNQQDVVTGVARQIALAIENFELEESRKYEAYVTAVLLQVAEMVAASENLDETLTDVINLLPLLVGVDTALVYLIDEKTKRGHLSSSYSRSWKAEVSALPQTLKNGFSRSLEMIGMNQKPVFCQLKDHSPSQWLQYDYRPFLKNNRVPKHLILR